jgi:pSer/pThr/pTyr-binding forkhead associated (FHA) protein/class 3 adenylate cyclase
MVRREKKIGKDTKGEKEPEGSDPGEFSTSGIKLRDILKKRRELDEQRRALEAQEKKIQKIITVMFTDLKDSTKFADADAGGKGSFELRLLLDYHNDIVFPLIDSGNGRLIKTMGDGTMSYFLRAQDAVCTAVKIQKEIAEFNKTGKSTIPILIRIGIDTGKGIVDEDKEKGKIDIFGDVANVASRFENLAQSREVLFSEGTYNALRDKEEIYCRFRRTEKIKGKSKPVKVFKAFWDEEEIEADKASPIITVEEGRRPASTNRMDIVKEGYSYTQTSMELAAEAAKEGTCLVVQREEKDKVVVPIDEDELTIGRTAQNNIVLDEKYISRKHARVSRKQGTYWIEDLKSSIGVEVNGKKISKAQLQNGDEIKLGAIRIVFVNPKKEPYYEEATTKMDVTTMVPTVGEEVTMAIASQSMYKLAVRKADGGITEHDIPKEGLILGRSATAGMQLNDPVVSRRHAKITVDAKTIFIEDLGSNNGTCVDNKRLQAEQKVEIKEKQLITIGDFNLLVVNVAQNVDQSFFSDTTSSISKRVKKLWGKGER